MNLFSKFNTRLRFLPFIALCALLLLNSCSKHSDKRSELLDNVNDKVVVALTFNPAAIIRSAGGDVQDGVVTMPDAIEKIMKNTMTKSERRIVDRMAEIKGLNLESMAMAIYSDDDDEPLVSVLGFVADENEFVSWLEDNDFEEEKDKNFRVFAFNDDKPSVVIDGDIVYLLMTDVDNAPDVVKDLKRGADSRPLASWKKDFLCKSESSCSVLTFLRDIPEKSIDRIYDNKYVNDDAEVLAMHQEINGLKVTTTAEFLDKNGSSCEFISEDAIHTLDRSILDEFPKNLSFYGAMSVAGGIFGNDISEMFKELHRELLRLLIDTNIRQYDEYDVDYWYSYRNPMRERLDSIARSSGFTKAAEKINALGFGIGMKNNTKVDLTKASAALTAIDIKAVANFNSEKSAQDYFMLWNNAALPGQTAGDKFSSFKSYELDGMELFLGCNCADVVLGNEKSFAKSSKSYPCELKDAVAFTSLNLPKNGSVIKSMPLKIAFGIDAWCKVSRNSLTVEITLTDTEGGFIENMLDMSQKVISLISGFSHGNNYDDAEIVVEEVELPENYDYAYADTTVVEEVVETSVW